MQYFGGKTRIAGQIATVINALKPEVYVEPFCGGCSVATKVEAPIRILSDLHPDLIAMWQALQDGWVPPDTLTEEEYYYWKAMDSPEPMRAFAGFGCSFAGKFFGGYARGHTSPLMIKNALRRKIEALGDCAFHCTDYADAFQLEPDVAYCDPPYDGTTGYAVGRFDTARFWGNVRDACATCVILVSEYAAPLDFTCLREMPTRTEIRTGDNQRDHRIERLFVHERHASNIKELIS